ncbi:metalloprotease [Halomicrobium sp. IBSBa]|uniref:metalloprotease n=1 Tax=Halomicrobium sp. IBSBa TaxID=2778916 RepID=UPI001ABF5C6D|nr:metalloprotease [Halomicrobium sp. IBSBa]MBO4246556.1 metalloprotease [Halomicrobium sp. IBSBa]
MNVRFSERELKDLLIAWLALGLAFAIFINYDMVQGLLAGRPPNPTAVVGALAVSLFTAGIGFLLHELAHKVVAVRFGQIAEFRADYNMLFLAVISALAGFLFAAPGAVHHRGRITERENGLIALAGPVTNVVLALVFVVPLVVAWLGLFGGLLFELAALGVSINLLLAGFNMIPFGPLDGKKVLAWSKPVYAVVAAPMLLLGVFVLLAGVPGL